MKLKSVLLVATVALTFFACGSSLEGTADYAIIPQPQQTNQVKQVTPFVLDKHTCIVIPTGDSEMERIAGFLNNYVCECTGYQLPISSQISSLYHLKLQKTELFSVLIRRLRIQKAIVSV